MRPRTPSGRVALWLFGAFVTPVLLFFAAVSVGERGGEEFFDNLWLSVPILGAWFASVAAGVAGLASVLRGQERAVSVLAVIVVAVVVLFYGVAELAVPH